MYRGQRTPAGQVIPGVLFLGDAVPSPRDPSVSTWHDSLLLQPSELPTTCHRPSARAYQTHLAQLPRWPGHGVVASGFDADELVGPAFGPDHHAGGSLAGNDAMPASSTSSVAPSLGPVTDGLGTRRPGGT